MRQQSPALQFEASPGATKIEISFPPPRRQDPQTVEERPEGETATLERAPHDSSIARAAVLDELLRIQEFERKRLGQELHDSAGQLVISLQFGISRLKNLAEGTSQAIVEEMGDIVRQIDSELRSLAFLQYPAELCHRDVFSAVRALVYGFERRTGINMSFKGGEHGCEVDAETSAAVLRVAQEALVNIHRHAHATSAKVVLEGFPDRLQLTISDNGVGMPAGNSPGSEGLGLEGMRHRIDSLGGRFRIAGLKHGTKISATVPLGAH